MSCLERRGHHGHHGQLLRFVARGFYSRPYILILDAVLIHSVLSEDDLIYLLGINRKELRSLCNKLVDHIATLTAENPPPLPQAKPPFARLHHGREPLDNHQEISSCTVTPMATYVPVAGKKSVSSTPFLSSKAKCSLQPN
ncbi:hypothetical protein E0198_000857 [Clavispora lusitaniae]|nr:hypothetical protein E0198_000857 [Clavispora lusitaniae]